MVFNPADKQVGENKNQPAVHNMYENWFIDYASYVILERAVPAVEDGLKPVQRRILHAMYEMEDGRYNKVANIIGQSMQYHPHGDASIGDAIINIGQKDLLIDTQGNWGDIRTGDPAAAPRYIEARLSKFALEILFNPKTTGWQLSYDGRKREPLTLPVKFPLLLAQGVDGIAVGLSTRVLPHNFIELIKGSIDILRNKKVNIYPDFPTGGQIDVANYNDGKRGGKVRVRARIEELDKKTLVIREIPFGTTTGSLIDSILKANDNGKIKVRKVEDNTAKNVEIVVHLAAGVSTDITIDALYAFTDCEISISPNCCVIVDKKPQFIGVTDLLKVNTDNTQALLKQELEIKLNELEEEWHYSSLEKIFIEKRIYRDIEECETWEAVIQAIDKGLSKYKKLFRRAITEEDILRLTEIKIKRISKYDSFKADEHIKGIEADIEQTKYDLEHLRDYTIKYYENLLKKYGAGRERKTEIKTFDTIKAQTVALANQKLYVNREDGFVGYGLKKDEFVTDCSDLDDIIVFREDGKMMITRVAEKTFVGKKIIYLSIFKKNDERTTYHLIYRDGKVGNIMVKRFNVSGITRDKEYDLTKGSEGSKVHYFSINPNAESERIRVVLDPRCKAKIKDFEYNFAELAIKGRTSQGNILTRYPIKSVKLIEKGPATIQGIEIWFDDTVCRLNKEGKGKFVGSFQNDDKILVVYENGHYELTSYELTNRYDSSKVLIIEKYHPSMTINCLYMDGNSKTFFIKRFNLETLTTEKKFMFITEHPDSKVVLATTNSTCLFEIKSGKKKTPVVKQIQPDKFIEIKGWKALGNKAVDDDFIEASILDSTGRPSKISDSNTDEYHEKKGNATSTTSTTQSVKTNFKIPASTHKSDVEWDIGPTKKKEVTKNNKSGQTELF